MEQIAKETRGYDPTGGALGQYANAALGPSLSGQAAMQFNPLQGQNYSNQFGAFNPQQFNPMQFVNPQGYTPQQYNSPASFQAQQYNPAGQAQSTLNLDNLPSYFKTALQDPMMRMYQQQVAPGIAAQYANSGSAYNSRMVDQQQRALGDMTTQIAAQQAQATNTDILARSQQDLGAQQFNLQNALNYAGMNSANAYNAAQLNSANQLQTNQLNAGQNLSAAQLNSQNQLQTEGLNSQNYLQTEGLNSQNALAGAQLNRQTQMGYDQLNAQNQLAYNTLNTNTMMNLAENARQNQLQAAGMAQNFASLPLQRMTQMENNLMPFQNRQDQQSQLAYQEWLRTQPYNNPYLSNAFQYIGQGQKFGVPYQPASGMNQLGQAAGLGMAGTGALLGNTLAGGTSGGLLGMLFGAGAPFGF